MNPHRRLVIAAAGIAIFAAVAAGIGSPGSAAQTSEQGRERGAARAELTALPCQVPGRQSLLSRHPGEQTLRLGPLKRHRPQRAAAIPEEKLGERPAAESAVFVVENDRAGHSPKRRLRRCDS